MRHPTSVSMAQVPLNSPFIPPIFLTIWANLVYCMSNSCTSLWLVPEPLATLVVLPGCWRNSLAPCGWSSSVCVWGGGGGERERERGREGGEGGREGGGGRERERNRVGGRGVHDIVCMCTSSYI